MRAILRTIGLLIFVLPLAVPALVEPAAAPTVLYLPVVYRASDLTGSLSTCGYAGGRLCIVETIYNHAAEPIHYGLLGVNVVVQACPGPEPCSPFFQTSWSGDLWIDPGCTGPTDHCGGPWEDGLGVPAGTYRLELAVCFSVVDVCAAGDGYWETLAVIAATVP